MIDLPLCPPTNNLYRNVSGVGRVKSSKYRAWLKEAGWELQAQRKNFNPIKSGWYNVDIMVSRAMRGDVDGRVKAPVDLLVEHKLVPDDKKTWAVSVRRSDDVPAGRMHVRASPA